MVRAYDEALDDSVAIKVLADNWSTDADIRGRFVEEARLLRRIRSDDLVTVHDIGTLEDGRPYFVMTFAERGTLSDRLQRRRSPGLDPLSARRIVNMLAGGLGALHAAGIVHRDVNPRNILVRPLGVQQELAQRRVAATQVRTGLLATDERLLLGDLGLAKDFVRSGTAGASVVGGTPHYLAPEQLDANATIGPAADIYAATAVLWESLMATQPPGPAELASAAAAADPQWRTFFTRGLAEDPADRMEDAAEWRTEALVLIDKAQALVGAGAGTHVSAGAVASNPYKGLTAFQPDDAARFFGRDGLVATLTERLSFERVLVVGGPSGSGKSSVVRAGLIPAVAGGALSGSERWPVALLTPRASPTTELSYQLTKLSQAITQRGAGLPDTFITQDAGQARFLAETITDASGGLLLVIDQFEELFTLSARSEQQAFIDLLSTLTDPTDSRVRVVIVVRADFYGSCATFPWLAERITTNQVLVGPMTRSELRSAIEQPATAAALRLEHGLVDNVLDDGGSEPGALPLVSHTMAETWRRRRGSTLTIDGYQQSGGVAGAIAQTAEALYGGFGPEEQAACRNLMLRLVAPGEGTSDSRRRLPMVGLDSDESGGVSRQVAEEMVEARLLTVDRESIEIAHEALLRTWPRLRRWTDESRDDLRIRQRIAHAASEWTDEGRDPDLLYRGTPLQSALEWAALHGDVLDIDDREFLDAGAEAARLATEAAADRERKSRRLRRIAVSVLAVLTVVAVTASIVALAALGNATARFGQSLATQAAALAESDPRVSSALAVEAIARTDSSSMDARVALVESSETLEAADLALAASPAVAGDALSVAVSPNGQLIATGNRDGSIRLWSATGAPLGDAVPGHEKAINELVFGLEGRTLVTASDDGTVRVWNLDDPSQVPPPLLVGEAGRLVWSVDLAADGVTLATASEDGTIRLWDLAARQQIGAPLIDSDRDFLTVSFDPTGTLLLAGNGRGEVTGWSVPDRQVVIDTFNAHESDVWEIEFDAAGEVFATASSDGTVRLWDAATVAFLGEPLSGVATDLRGVQIIDPERISAGDEVGRLWTANLDGSARQSSPSPHRGQIVDTATSGGVLATLGIDQQLQPWSAARIPTAAEFAGFAGGAFGVAMSHDGGLIAVGDGSGNVSIISTGSNERVVEAASAHKGTVWALAFNDDGTQLASGGEDGVVVLIDPATGELAATLPPAGGAITALVFDDDVLLAGGDDEAVRVWDHDELIATLDGHRGGVTGMALSVDGLLAVSDRSGQVLLWEVGAGELGMPTMVADDNTIWDVAWSLDGTILATASGDEVVQLWDAGSQEPIASLAPHRGGALNVAFLPDGVTLAATSGDGTVRLWDVSLGRPVGAALLGHTEASWRIDASGEGPRFVTTSQDGTVRLWDVLDLQRACERAAGAFDAEQQLRTLGEGELPKGCVVAS